MGTFIRILARTREHILAIQGQSPSCLVVSLNTAAGLSFTVTRVIAYLENNLAN
jgi:hypothetical protein